MRILPVSNNNKNPNFEKLVISKKTLKSLGCSREDILKNEFINTWSNEFDIAIFKNGAEFVYNIGHNIKTSLFSSKPKFDVPFLTGLKFKTREELDNIVKKSENTFYELKYFSKTWSIIPRNHNEALHYIANIPDDPKFDNAKKYCISSLENNPIWFPVEDSSLIRKVIKNNNIALLKLLKSKGENLNAALEMMEKDEVSEEAKEVLQDVKYHDEKIFMLENCAGSEYLRNRFLAENPNIDINSRNKNRDTLVTKAFKEKNWKLLEFLLTIENVNWNVYDRLGCNAAGIILHNGDIFENSYDINFLMKIPSEKYDINAPSLDINHIQYDSYIKTPLEMALENNQSYLHALLQNPNLDVMTTRTKNYQTLLLRPEKQPLAFYAIDRNIDIDNFKDIINHPSFNWEIKFDNLDMLTFTKRTKYHDIVKQEAPLYFINEASQLYTKNGILSLEYIEKLIEVFKSIDALKQPWINFSINFVHDNIGHLLVDTPVDTEDFDKMSRLSKILETLKNSNFDFSKKNLVGQTVLDKAIEAENTGLLKLLEEYSR